MTERKWPDNWPFPPYPLGIAALTLALAGCATEPPFTPKKFITKRTMVTWELVDDVTAVCNQHGAKVPGAACALADYTTCRIFTSKTPTMYLLGHELRHCFEGAWHD